MTDVDYRSMYLKVRDELAELQQREQEPVAWYRDEDGIRMYYDAPYFDDATPLYSAQCKWVELTHEEAYKRAMRDAVGLLKTQHELVKGRHNYYRHAANIIHLEFLEEDDDRQD